MAVPVLITPYVAQAFTVLAPISIDIASNWTGATAFEIASLPPDTVYTPVTTTINGTATTNMDYTVYIRGVNDDGAADWAPLQLTTTGQVTFRTLWGLSTDWQIVHASGITAVLFIRQATIAAPGNFSGTGRLLVNDIDNDGNASIYPSNRLYSQLLLNGGAATWVRATEPGWEVIIDTSQLA